jgi:hypothetical protein
MARLAGTVLAPADAADFRARLGRRKEQKGLTTDAIVGLDPTRTQRWFYAALDPKRPLLVATAVDLASRMQTLGARLPDTLIRRLQRPVPALFLPPGGADEVADALMPLYGLTGTVRNRVHRETVKFFRRYERVALTPTIADAFTRIKGELGGDPHWRRVFGQLLAGHVEAIDPLARGHGGLTEGVVAPSPLAVAREQHPSTKKVKKG